MSWGFGDFWVWLFWLRGGEWDGGVDEVEGAALIWRGFGEHGDVGAGAGVADLVAGQGGEVVEQAREAAQRIAKFVVLGGGLGVGVGGALGGGDGVVPLGWVFVGECHWGPGLAQVPDEVAGEHADQHVGFDAVVEAVVDGP